MWVKLASIAFGDAIHDAIIKMGQRGSTIPAAKTWQCEEFFHALPAPPLVPKCDPGAPAANRGLAIEENFKNKSFNSLDVEPHIFNFVTGELHDTTGNVVDNNIEHMMDNSIVGSATPPPFYFTTTNGKRYSLRTIQWGPGTGITETDVTVQGQQLMQNLGMPDGTAILVDHQVNKFITQLKSGTAFPWRLYHLMTPEYLADSASRVSWAPTKKYFKDEGVQFCFAGKYQANYPPWTENTRNTFFSKYSCDMTADWTTKKCTQTWSDNNGGGVGQVFTTNDAHKDNNEHTVDAYTPPATSGAALRIEQLALKYHRKRSGDQLQVLAVKRLSNNDTFNISDDGVNAPGAGSNYNTPLTRGVTVTGAPAINPKGATFLVTHDLTCLAYALHLGVNAIFTRSSKSNKKTAMSFKIATTNLPPGTPPGTPAGNLNDNTN